MKNEMKWNAMGDGDGDGDKKTFAKDKVNEK